MPPEETTVPVPAPMAAPAPARDSRMLLLGIVIVAALIVLGVLAYLNPNVLKNLWPGQHKALPGTLVMRVSAPWKAPSGETMSGTISYTPSTNAVSYVFSPASLSAAMVSGESFSSDGEHSAALQFKGSAFSIVTLSRALQDVDSVVATVSATSTVGGISISNDGSHVAYQVIPSLQALLLSPLGKTYFVTEGATSTLRAGVTLPAQYQPKTMVVTGKNSVMVGEGVPLLFSPDGTKLLTAESGGLLIQPVAGGDSVAVSGDLGKEKMRALEASPSGSYIAGVDEAGVTVYSIDWATGTTAKIGAIPQASQAVFDAHTPHLLVIQGGQVAVYSLSAAAIQKSAQYDLSLPATARLISWNTP